MIKMKDDSTKLMANLLHQGATMLDEYCIKCGKILFRLRKGKIFCPSCESDVVSDKRYDENEIKGITLAYTPTPGGIGPINIAYLMYNLVKAWKIQNVLNEDEE